MEETTEYIIKQTITESVNVDPDIAAEVRTFTKMMMDEARTVMAFGMSGEKMQLMKIFFGSAVRSVGRDFTTVENEAKVALEDIFTSMRELPPEALHVASIATVTPPVDHSDKEPVDGTVPD